MGHLLVAAPPRPLRSVGAPLDHRHAHRLALACLVVLVCGLAGRTASANVFATGDVYPADDVFSADDEGLPLDGNAINPNEDPDHQTFFEGRHDDGADPFDITDDENINDNIIVGGTITTPPLLPRAGYLTISAETALRYMNLVVGNAERSYGEVHITGPAAVFNNNFLILPPNLPANFGSETPRDGDPRASMFGLDTSANGLDLYVGRSGTAQMFIDDGGRAEIHDGVFVGYNAGSTGSLYVDGFGSLLVSGGLANAPSTGDHLMIIGRQGTGFMQVQNGGTVISEAPPAGGGSATDINFGVVIGALEPATTTEPGQPGSEGGEGTVTVTGTASEWIIGGSLQIGGFHNNILSGIGTSGDLEGNDAIYNSNSGAGTLVIDAGGLAHLRPAIDSQAQQDPLVVAIGRLGNLLLTNGYLSLGDQSDRVSGSNVSLVNDGEINGGGRIDTGSFRNRYFGEVFVNAGQKLIIAATAEVDTQAQTQIVPLVNFGLIEVIGEFDHRAELEIERATGDPQVPDDVQPFLNLLLPQDEQPVAPDIGSRGGLIHAQHATLRFGSGLLNRAQMSFTAGMNIVHGDVMNIAPEDVVSPDDGDLGDFTNLLVSGPDTTVIFQNQLGNSDGADIILQDGADIIVQQDLAVATQSEITIELSRTNPSTITVMGDLGLTQAEFNLKFATDAFPPAHGDAFLLISFGGDVGGVDITNPLRPVPDLSMPPTIADLEVSPSLFEFGLLPFIEIANDGVYARFFDPTMIGPPGGPGAIGPDFNGDGVVDLEDIAIWEQFEGCQSGCNVLTGDADGDGDVDGDDLAFILRNLGMPPPWAGGGAGSGSSALGANVPEPTGLALLISSGLLALAFRRRRSA